VAVTCPRYLLVFGWEGLLANLCMGRFSCLGSKIFVGVPDSHSAVLDVVWIM